jgi:SAM-dependent methyltransferase
MGGLLGILSNPKVYELWSSVVGGKRGRKTLVDEHVRPRPGARVLDLGCGPGELVSHLGEVSYVGLDRSAEYIEQARRAYGDRAEFRVGDATKLAAELTEFDLVLAFGVLHHLDDEQAESLLRGAAGALRAGGRFVAVDPTLVANQSRAARYVVTNDRGRHVRSPEEYERLASQVFTRVRKFVRSDLLRIPYTHCVLECS